MNASLRRCALGLVAAIVLAAATTANADEERQSPPPHGNWDDARALAAFVDEQLVARWAQDGIVPAESADDAEWLRRVYLDLSGVIPSAWEVREFLASDDPNRREQVVDRLLTSPAHATHFATVWTKALVPEMKSSPQFQYFSQGFENWLRNQFTSRRPYDETVRELLSYEMQPRGRSGNFFANMRESTPLAFYLAKGGKPENLAASTARVLLGVRIECAQCHDHPFADWQQDQFWQLAAFYGGIKKQNEEADFSPIEENPTVREITVTGTDRVVKAALFDGSTPEWKEDVSSRTVLAEWATSPENPYFARATVNRLWGMLFGVGLVHPVDDFDPGNPPSHPEILNRLADQFAARGFDLQFILRTLVSTRAYQLTSRVTDPSQNTPRAFAVMPVRGLSGEQLFDSLARSIGIPAADLTRGPGVNSAKSTMSRMKFLETFQDQTDSPIDYESSILQALMLMNGDVVSGATGKDSRTLIAAVDFPGLSTAERLETLFLATVSRPPTDEERDRLLAYIEEGESERSVQELSDIFWSLLNSSEFVFNH